MDECIKCLKRLINFGVDSEEKLTNQELKLKMSQFRKNLKFEDYVSLFNKVDSLITENVGSIDLDILIRYLIEFIRSYSEIEDNVHNMPKSIQSIYYSYYKFYGILLKLEQIENYDFCAIKPFENILENYFKILDDFNNNLFINCYYSFIEIINVKINSYINKIDQEGNSFKNSISFSLLEALENRLNNIKGR